MGQEPRSRSIPNFPHDLEQIPEAPNFQAISVAFKLTFTWAEPDMAGH